MRARLKRLTNNWRLKVFSLVISRRVVKSAYSALASMLAVGSSKTNIGASFASARVTESRCHSPPERLYSPKRRPSTVSSSPPRSHGGFRRRTRR